MQGQRCCQLEILIKADNVDQTTVKPISETTFIMQSTAFRDHYSDTTHHLTQLNRTCI